MSTLATVATEAVLYAHDVETLAFEVASIEQVAGAIGAFGGSISPATWEFAGHHRRDATDPEGNVIQLLEPLAFPATEALIRRAPRRKVVGRCARL